MSSQSITSNTGSQLFVNTDTSKIFLGGNYTRQEGFINNSGYNPIVLPAGTVMGRVAFSGTLAPFNSAASDGTQFVCGILTDDVSLAAGATVTASITVAGRVAQDKVSFFPTSFGMTIDTVVSGRRIKDKIMAETTGILLVVSTEMTDYDNS